MTTTKQAIDALPFDPADPPKDFAVDHLKGDLIRALIRFAADPDARVLYRMLVDLESIATRREHQAFVAMAVQIALRRRWMEGTRE